MIIAHRSVCTEGPVAAKTCTKTIFYIALTGWMKQTCSLTVALLVKSMIRKNSRVIETISVYTQRDSSLFRLAHTPIALTFDETNWIRYGMRYAFISSLLRILAHPPCWSLESATLGPGLPHCSPPDLLASAIKL